LETRGLWLCGRSSFARRRCPPRESAPRTPARFGSHPQFLDEAAEGIAAVHAGASSAMCRTLASACSPPVLRANPTCAGSPSAVPAVPLTPPDVLASVALDALHVVAPPVEPLQQPERFGNRTECASPVARSAQTRRARGKDGMFLAQTSRGRGGQSDAPTRATPRRRWQRAAHAASRTLTAIVGPLDRGHRGSKSLHLFALVKCSAADDTCAMPEPRAIRRGRVTSVSQLTKRRNSRQMCFAETGTGLRHSLGDFPAARLTIQSINAPTASGRDCSTARSGRNAPPHGSGTGSAMIDG
jgi:hypothetical protein